VVEAFSGGRIFLLSVIVALLTSVIISPVRDSAQLWIDRLFYRERYNASLMLQRLSQATVSMLDLDKITKVVLTDVVETLHIGHAAIFIKHNSDDSFHLLAEEGAPKIPAMVFSGDHPIVKWLIRENRILSRKTLSVTPIFRAIWKKELDYLNEFPAQLFIPLNTKGELVGFFIVGSKRSTQSYTHDDEVTLSTLANQTAVIIENARLYEDLEETFVQTVVALANAIDMRDTYTSSHSQRIAEWAEDIALLLGCTAHEAQAVYWGGLLHDIGMVAEQDDEGTHVEKGVAIAKKYGLPEEVINAIAEHHEDKPFSSTESVIVWIADAISGSRPGARYEPYENYVKRMTKIEEISGSFSGVEQAIAFQAGRDVRIIVRPEEVEEDKLTVLANDIARRLEKEAEYAGQVKVTVIRETRAQATTAAK